MKKKYPKRRWMSFFDHVLLVIAEIIVAVIMIRALTAYSIGGIILTTILCTGGLMIEVYIKPREYSYVQLKEDGIYWKSVWGRTYVYFPWEDVEQAGFIQGISLTTINDLDSATRRRMQSEDVTMAYVSTKKIRDYRDIVCAIKVTQKKGRGWPDMLEMDEKEDVYFFCYQAMKKKKEEIKEELIGYIGEEKWAPEMDQYGNWIPEDGRPIWVPIDEWEADKAEKQDE